MSDHVLEVCDVEKRFGATTALDRVSLKLREGEILALLGDNGAGKSTLIKILSGVVRPDGGEIRIDGKRVDISSPHRARELGIETVYQDLALFDNFNATGNFYAGREPVKPKWLGSLGWVSDRLMAKETEELLDRLQVNISRTDEIGIMSGGQRQAVACARAIAFGKRIVILDEPTSALGARESGNVLRLIKEAPEHGVSVIVISHNLEHVTRVADRAVVLRQGRYVGEAEPDADHQEELVSMIVGSGEGSDGEEPSDRERASSNGEPARSDGESARAEA
ncbi:MAG: sugar ABC transporter ATP-binding protein [Solirubrobacterales bacterium]|nr:sugar ABC transporter ATP-binding protein [Solirubrobacterales bacterium]MBV8943874.1 sugar ABC transporter ATP-binding protein [Solirubrobacterales bacterium]MBV9362760.1 sugar ABC transporter ATP-binding protein [Solirubrobacterales bacterium]MBV9680451.1 sugar ABC transporter ATP-binding protein [Solirubrobacterales bacterium]MBV9808535.1 sugar ABC transporter ATP-binding protein [Solirubrobacterales bacterium]